MEKDRTYFIFTKYNKEEDYYRIVRYLKDNYYTIEVDELPEDESKVYLYDVDGNVVTMHDVEGTLLRVPDLSFDEIFDIVDPYAIVMKWYPNE